MSSGDLKLNDGDTIGVVGGGPSGSFFTYFALELAQRFGLEISLEIIEAKNFLCTGPAGCNHCGGIVSESLIQMLSAEGIVLPSEIIKQGIESYTLHLEQGSAVITAPFNEQRIAAMYRGGGPKGEGDGKTFSFDNHLLKLCESKGAKIIYDRVTDAKRNEDGIVLTFKSGLIKKYQLVVGAVGLNKKTFSLFHELCPDFVVPESTKTYISEIQLQEDQIEQYFGDSMHVFLLNIPRIKFGAIIPKRNYLTLVLLGSEIDHEVVQGFMDSKAVRDCFPPGFDLSSMTMCQCFPFINVKGARLAYSDRVVLVGDSSTSKLYKNGIGAAYITAKAAANTAVFHGISDSDFKKHFLPVCKKLQFDNRLGRYIFALTSAIQRSAVLKRAVLRMVFREKKIKREKRIMSSMLWDTFTGSTPYNSIFYRFFNPRVFFYFVWDSVISVFTKKISNHNEI